jgi:hypothetical protein
MSKQGNQPADWAAMFEEPCPRYDRDGWDAVFDWWYRIGQDKLGTLVNLAGHMGVAIQTLYNKHPEYKEQYGQKPMRGQKKDGSLLPTEDLT